MYATESWKTPTPHPQTEQDIYSTVRAQLSLQDNLEHSLIIVFLLFHTEEEDMEWTSESKTRARPTRMLMLSSQYMCVCVCVSLFLCGQKSEQLIEGSISSSWPWLAGRVRLLVVLKWLYPFLTVTETNGNHAYSHISL